MSPPHVARTLIQRAVAADAAGRSILADLDAEYLDRCATHGHARATRWYWRQAWSMWWWSAWSHPPNSFHQPVGGGIFDVIGDLRHAVRVALATPAQSALIVGTLALAVGTTTIGFAFADTVFLRGLPIAEPHDTVIVYGVDARDPERRTGIFASDYLEFRDRARTVEHLSTWTQTRVTMHRTGRDAARLTVSRVSGDLFGVWELRTQLGRGLRPGDDAPGGARVAVLSDWYWREAFGASTEALGTMLMLDGVPHTVVGVLTQSVEFGTFANIAMWVSHPLQYSESRDVRPVMVTGRIAGERTADEAAAEFRAIAANLEQEHPTTNRGRQTLVLPASRAMGGPNLWLVMTLLVGTAALVTVIASVNVAGVLLARAVARQREFALRVALGARKIRVFRQLVAEGVLLASLGAGTGLVITEGGLRLIRSVDAEPIFQQIVIDWHEVVFVSALALISPLLFSLAPALSSLRVNLVGALNAGSARMTGSGRRLRDVLAAAQLALAVALAVVGGLVARTATAQMTAPNGFDVRNLVTFTMTFDHLATPQARRHLASTIESLLRDRGLEVGMMATAPAAAIETSTVIELDGVPAASGRVDAWAHTVAVSEHALVTLRVPILAGRGMTTHDVANNAGVALISREAAIRYFNAEQEAIGRELQVRHGEMRRSYQIIGVTGDVRNTDPERGMPPRVWLPLAEPVTAVYVVRGDADVATTSAAIRETARQAAPGVPVESLESYARAIARTQGGDRVAMGMLLSFAAMAILFAAIGLYGTVALSASLRRAEFATRYALGAQRADVARLVLRQAFSLLALGLVPGLGLGLLAATGMRRLLFGVSPLDPLNLAAVISLLTVITLCASAAPALRSARLDAIAVLRRG